MPGTNRKTGAPMCQIEGCGQPADVVVVWLGEPDMDLLCHADHLGMMSAAMQEWAQNLPPEQVAAASQGG